MMSPNMLSVTITSNPLRVLDHPHAGGVDVGVVALDVGVVGLADLIECALPEIEGVGQHVGLAAQGQGLLAVALTGIVESIAQAALDRLCGC